MKKHEDTLATRPQFPKSYCPASSPSRTPSAKITQGFPTSLMSVLWGVFLFLIVLIGCEPKQQIDYLKVGRQQLLNSGLAVDAVKHLKQAEVNELDKAPPRALLVLAYTHALSTGTAKAQGLEPEFMRERTQRLAALGDEEIEHLLQILVRRSRLQKDAMQVVVDKGVDTFPVLISALGNVEFQNLHSDIIEMMYQIGASGDGLELMVDAIQNAETSTEVKIALIRLIGRIGGQQGLADLEIILNRTSDAGLKMEISVTLFRLGKNEYSTTIVEGLDSDDVNVRRAAARALIHLSDYPVASVLNALQDTDDSVITYAAQALQSRPTEQAVVPLTQVLTGSADNAAKQAASEALRIHAEQKLTKGLTTRLAKALVSGNIDSAEDRLRILQLLRKDALMKQIRVASLVNPQLVYDLDQYLKQTETHKIVKEELRRLLSDLE